MKYSKPTDFKTLYVDELISQYQNWNSESDRIYKILKKEGDRLNAFYNSHQKDGKCDPHIDWTLYKEQTAERQLLLDKYNARPQQYQELCQQLIPFIPSLSPEVCKLVKENVELV